MDFEKDNVQAKYVFEIIVWLGLIILAYVTWPVLIIVVLAALILSIKISSNTKLLKAHIKRLEDIENERSASVNSHSKGLIIDKKS